MIDLMLKTADIRRQFKDLYSAEKFVIDKTGVRMVEIYGANFLADEEAIFGTVNYDYVQRELDWYKSMSLNVYDMPGGVKQETNPPQIWMTVADPDGMINSNYGWCIWHPDNGNQYENVVDELRANPYSRRATMIYTRPTMWTDYNKNGRSDFMCTNAVQYLIRDDKLHSIVQMRSNDVVFGYKNDRAWQHYVLLQLCDELGIECGDIIWNVGSLHVYERHFSFLE